MTKKNETAVAPNHWHALDLQDVFLRAKSDVAHGLSPEEVRRRQKEFGPNRVTARRGTPVWLKFLKQFNQPLVYILLVAVGVTAFLGEWVDSSVIFGVVINTSRGKLVGHRRAHRDAQERPARRLGLRVIIAGAGGAAHLPGMVASLTPLPVIGVPVESKSLAGLDSLLSIVQMPGGAPVATVAIGGGRNAGLLAVRILCTNDPALRLRMVSFQTRLAKESRTKDRKLRAEVTTKYRF